mmetsp:Transcript_28465/g.72115  ORF Transcript_28465/g.72115 Transcript_28465/m.72115 type:complete len:274 (-) Transcript_28465:77-898(-)
MAASSAPRRRQPRNSASPAGPLVVAAAALATALAACSGCSCLRSAAFLAGRPSAAAGDTRSGAPLARWAEKKGKADLGMSEEEKKAFIQSLGMTKQVMSTSEVSIEVERLRLERIEQERRRTGGYVTSTNYNAMNEQVARQKQREEADELWGFGYNAIVVLFLIGLGFAAWYLYILYDQNTDNSIGRPSGPAINEYCDTAAYYTTKLIFPNKECVEREPYQLSANILQSLGRSAAEIGEGARNLANQDPVNINSGYLPIPDAGLEGDLQAPDE